MMKARRTIFWRMNKGCCTLIDNMRFAAVMLYAVLLICGCNSSHNKVSEQQQEHVSERALIYQEPNYPTQTYTAPETTTTTQEYIPKSEPTQMQPQPHPQPTQETTISRYYEEGYEKGYDDGEDDAVMDNGWGGQFDDSCPYKGKKRKDFQLGYEEGYEAGYYDNKDGDE